MALIQKEPSIVLSCDMEFNDYLRMVKDTHGHPCVGAYKIGSRSGRKGWESWVDAAREHTDRPLIMDGQKWGNDIPDMGMPIMEDLKESGFDAVILFPFTGPVSQYEWTRAAQESGLHVIIGSRMTHPRQIDGDYSNPKNGPDYTEIFRTLRFAYDQTGYIRSMAFEDAYRLAARMGVTDFVVPGNDPEIITRTKLFLKDEDVDPVLYSPGFFKNQGGRIKDAYEAAGDRWHAIVGRSVTQADNYNEALDEISRDFL